MLATVFSSAGGYESPQAFVDGLIPALWVGTVVLGAGALVALLMPSGTAGRRTELRARLRPILRPPAREPAVVLSRKERVNAIASPRAGASPRPSAARS